MPKDFFYMIALLLILVIIWLVVPGWMVRRAMPAVIKILRNKNAVGVRNAKTAQELGLQPKPFVRRLFGRRDYKPKALEYLVQYYIVLVTEDGKLYITDTSVARGTWLKLK